MAFPQPKPQKPELPRKLLRTLECRQGAVRAVRFNVDGNYCLTCGTDKSLKLWNPHKGTLLKTYNGHGYEVLDAHGSFDNSHLCSCSSDKTVVLWDVSTGQVVRKFRGHAGVVNCVQFNEEATVILSGSIDTSIRCWDCRSRRPDPIQIMDEAKDGVSSVKVSDHEILAGSVDGHMRRYDLRMGELHADYVGSKYPRGKRGRKRLVGAQGPPELRHLPAAWPLGPEPAWIRPHLGLLVPGPVTSVCFSKDGQCVLASSLDSTLRLLDKDTGEMLGEYSGHKNLACKLDCCLSEQDTHVGSGSENGKVYFWDLVEGSLALTLPVGGGVVQSLAFHPSEPCLLTASEGNVQCWQADSYTAQEIPG
ncbi:WD repeat domain-containing protein 83 isoform X1 [Tachyglossus aculeatus]|uniref:WD repeat domain-containing protein 83 isoform X1 n=1 Tax=Tachyglossus aculeatus TaxID=9261 RepID=UPI0018F28AEA|nr:WD repeat domain-containing protein 83 isoform X1 [Tachyglossus aculeatus]